MTTPQVHLNMLVMADGYHESAWLTLDQDPAASAGLDHYVRVAQTAERGLFDSIFFADRPGLDIFRAGYFPQIGFDPLDLVTALIAQTSHVGLIATASTTYNAPYDLARRFSTVDHLSGGRVGWNVVTTAFAATAANFGRAAHPEHGDRYARAGEFVDVVKRLWDSWDDDAVVADRETGVWAQPGRIRPAGFHGDFYDVGGALPLPRSPQGHPVLAQAGSSDAGVDLAGRVASLVFTPQPTLEAGRAFRARQQAAAVAHGRPAGSVLALPGLAFVLGSTETEALSRRARLEELAKTEFRWRNLLHLTGLDPALVDPDRPLSEEAIAAAPANSTTQRIVAAARTTGRTFREIADDLAVLPGQLEFTGTPEQLASLVEEWVTTGASDGFTLLPTTLPDSLELFVDHVVPILQQRGLHRTEYSGSTLRDHLGLDRPALVGA